MAVSAGARCLPLQDDALLSRTHPRETPGGLRPSPIELATTGHLPKNYAEWMKCGMACAAGGSFVCRFRGRSRLTVAIGALRTGIGVRVIR